MAAQILQPLGRCCHAGISHRRLGRLVRTAALVCMDGPHTASVPVLLCKRAPSFQDSVASVLAWQQAVEGRIDQIGDGFVRLDEGPSAEELKVSVWGTWWCHVGPCDDIIGHVMMPCGCMHLGHVPGLTTWAHHLGSPPGCTCQLHAGLLLSLVGERALHLSFWLGK